MTTFSNKAKQVTAKTALEVVEWVETHRHHKADALDPKFMVLSGNESKLRIPDALKLETKRYIEPSRDPFDSRMYRANRRGIKLLREAGKLEAVRAIQAPRKGGW